MQIGSVVLEKFLHIHTYIHTHGIGLSIRVTLNAKPASQVLITLRCNVEGEKNNTEHTMHRTAYV